VDEFVDGLLSEEVERAASVTPRSVASGGPEATTAL